MLPATIETRVAPETISKVGRLFNGSAHDVLSELLQNARRAGASMVTITTTITPGDSLIHIVDDGSGIADPAAVVTLGRSGWSDEIQRAEDGAGMGVFALAGRDVIIRSYSRPERQGWMAHIPAAAWESSRPIVVSNDPIDHGTAITVRMPLEWSQGLEEAVQQVARYYPLPVSFNGVFVDQEAWLTGAIAVEEWNGCMIGVFREDSVRARVGDPRLNFHGVTIPLPMDGIGEVGRGHSWNARVDIVNCPAIQLVLPARKEAVQTPVLDELRTAVTAAVFRAIAAQTSHRLAFSEWSRARSIGVVMDEAEPYLRGWIAPQADFGENYLSGTRVTDMSMVIMPEVDALVAQTAILAIERHSPFGGALVVEEPAFTGYSWYDTLARVEMIAFEVMQDGRCFTIDAETGAPADVESGYVDMLDLIATVTHAGAYIDVRCPAEIAFAADHELSTYVGDLAIFVRRGSNLTTVDVVGLAKRATFDPNGNGDSDSYETQRGRFISDATEHVVSILEGSDAALEARVRSLLSVYPHLIPSDRTVTITMTSDGLAVAIAERTDEVA
jgi:hypothetical protein